MKWVVEGRDAQDLLLAREVARLLSVTENTLAAWRVTGRGPRFLKNQFGHAISYRLADIVEFVNSGRPHGRPGARGGSHVTAKRAQREGVAAEREAV